jgi:hypothetical protein
MSETAALPECDVFDIQPISATDAELIAIGGFATLYLTNKNRDWDAIGVAVKKTTEANFSPFRRFPAPVPQNCTYPNNKQCAQDGKWENIGYIQCGAALNVKFLMQNNSNGELGETSPKGGPMNPSCAVGMAWAVIE